MNKSTLFKTAHKIARETVGFVGDYRIALSLALKEVYSMKEQTIEQKLIAAGGKQWKKGAMNRIYMNDKCVAEYFGLELSTEKVDNSDGVLDATDRKRINNSKTWFDVSAQKVVTNCATVEFYL